MKTDTLQKLNQLLPNLTFVSRFEFDVDMATGQCSVSLTLLDDYSHPSHSVNLVFEEIRELEVRGFGGGVTQILCLHGTDVRYLQHDRTGFFFEDLEERAIAFKCNSWSAFPSAVGTGSR